MKMKVLFIIPDGVGVKNYLLSKLVRLLQAIDTEIILLHNLPDEAIHEIEKYHQTPFEQLKLLNYKEHFLLKFLRESNAYSRLIYNSRKTKNSTILTNWKPKKNGLKFLFYNLVEIFGRFLSLNLSLILLAERFYYFLINRIDNPYIKLFKNIQPNVVFNTHQRSMYSILPLEAAKKLNIRNIGAIFSWDNLPKGRLTAKSDEYVVWSEYMKDEMQLYYPEIKPENMHITGTPQFEYYYDDSLLWSREDFCKKHQIDPTKKIIVYSGGDMTTSPFDHLYVEELAKQINNSILKNRIQILVRPAPVDHTDRYDEIIQSFPDLVKYSKPKWHQESDWSQTFPTFEDILLQVNTVHHCETVINVGSSMAFDFATRNKPAIYINFNIIDSAKWNIKTINEFQHFKSMEGLNPVLWWNKPEEIEEILNHIFNQNYKLDYIEWFEKINNAPKNASENIIKILT